MNAELRRRFEMAARVRNFLRTHQTEGVAEAKELGHLEELLKRAVALAAQQRAGIVAARAATEQRAGVREGLQRKLLRCLAAVGAAAAKGNIELGEEFRLSHTGPSHQAFLTMARGMLEKATALKDVLVGLGMSEKLLEELALGIAEFEETLEATRAGRLNHVGASADLRAVGSEVAERVRLLDGLVRYRVADNAELMGAWLSARNVPGPFRSHVEAKPAGGETPGVAVAVT